eukprot:g12690.t1
MAKAADGDLGATLHAIDEFAWAGNMLINVGDVKGKLLRDTARQVVADRLAAFFEAAGRGFSQGGEEEGKRELQIRLVEFAATPLGACTVTVRVRKKRSTDIMEEYEQQGLNMDLLFIDHVKKLYLPDLKRAVKTGVLGAKAVVIADNLLMPPPTLLGFTTWVAEHSETVERQELDDDRSDFEAIKEKHAHTQSSTGRTSQTKY